MVPRARHRKNLRSLLARCPVVAILGARQVGKTTLARALSARAGRLTTFFDLEDRIDVARLSEPTLTLSPLRGLVVLDEIHRRPDLFPVLRVLADRPRTPARFLVLGSAGPDLLRQSSESLAGRIAYYELGGFSLDEVGPVHLGRLWLRGGFPPSFLAENDAESARWRRQFIRTFLERDLPQLGIAVPSATMHRFWSMLAHFHGQVWNSSEFARSFGVSESTVRRYLDHLASTFVVRLLLPWHENLGKRQVKSPKVYLADSGLLHALLDLESAEGVERHPKLGASWEGFALDAVATRLGARRDQCFFWATHAGAELDLLVVCGGRRLGFEFKRTDAPHVTPSMRIALSDLKLERLYVVHGGESSFPMGEHIQAVALRRIWGDLKPLR